MVTTLLIGGMRSAHCARAVYTALATVPGIDAAEVVVGRATLEHRAPLDTEALSRAVSLAGYVLRDASTDRRRLALLFEPPTPRSPDAPENETGDVATPERT